jgi:hypothetical protein
MLLAYTKVSRNRWSVMRSCPGRPTKIAEITRRNNRFYISPEPGHRLSPRERVLIDGHLDCSAG